MRGDLPPPTSRTRQSVGKSKSRRWTRWLPVFAGLRASHEWLVLERDDEIVGFAYAQPLKRLAALRWSAETGICAGNGFHPSFGFEHVGLYRRVERNPCSRHNVAWMQLELLDGADRDAAPRPIT